jgi:hypothetical protein
VAVGSGVFVGALDEKGVIVGLEVKAACGIGVITVVEVGRQLASTLNSARKASPFQIDRNVFILFTLKMRLGYHQVPKYIPMRNRLFGNFRGRYPDLGVSFHGKS